MWLIMLIFLLCGIVIGGLLGELTQGISWLSWLSFGKEFGISSEVYKYCENVLWFKARRKHFGAKCIFVFA